MLNIFPTSSGMFISADEDKTGILDFIDEKISRATMIPREHGEVCLAFDAQVSTSSFFLIFMSWFLACFRSF